MKGSWVTSLAVGGVLLLLTLFLGLQNNWLGQASEADRERMQKRVEIDTKNFADDFNREIQAAYFNFQIGAATWEKADWTEFNERLDYWRSKTQYPELIREFVYFGKGKEPLKYDAQTRSFATGEIAPDLISLGQTIEGGAAFKSFYEDACVLVMPIHEPEKQFDRIMLRRTVPDEPPAIHMPERNGFLVIALERSVIADRILPELVSKHFPENNFRVDVKNKAESAVYETAGPVAQPDAKAGMLSLSPDSMIFFGDRSVWSQLKSEKRQDIVVSERTESTTFSHTETSPDGNKTGTFTIQLQPKKPAGPVGNAKTRTSVVATSGDGADPWTLNVQHVAGSIDAYVDNQRNKSFAIGLGVYLLLVGAIVAIVLSALRSKRFAQQQIDFVSSVSHEFRTPLAVIYSASENLADGVTKDREQVTRYGNLIKGEGKKLSSMVEQILEFAGARSGRKKYNFAPTDVSEVTRSALAECGPLLEENGFEVETVIAEGLRPVKADADALSSAIQNLIQNSVKYSNGSPWIRVAAENSDGKIKLTVADRGIGVSGDDMRHIFEPFYRAKSVVDAQIRGNGLGLALVKEVAEAHGGKVTAKSDLGKGSEFTIELPQA